MSAKNALLTILNAKIENDTLVLPTLPAIALEVRRATDNPNITLNAMGDIIAKDPSLSARIIKITNSAFLRRAVKVSSVGQAVTRIGLYQIKNISTAMAMEQLFVCKNDVVNIYLAKIWENTINAATYSLAVLQLYLSKHKTRELNLDTMTLAALVHNIGALPILTEAERHDDVFANPTFLDDAIEKVSPQIGGNIMRKWEFEETFIEIAESTYNLDVMPEKLSYIDFIRVGLVLAGQMKEHKDHVLNLALERGVLDDLADINSDDFNEVVQTSRSIFG